MKIELTPVSE
jgi:hypothetical protein